MAMGATENFPYSQDNPKQDTKLLASPATMHTVASHETTCGHVDIGKQGII
jgi:hypothetical protein